MHRLIGPLLAALVIGLSPVPATAQMGAGLTVLPTSSHEDAIASSREALQAAMDRHEIPGAGVAVWVSGRIVWSEGLGVSDLETRAPATDQTRFRIGSISKSLTAVALARLVEEGRVGLDDPVRRHLPDLPEAYAEVTLRQLASHTAGVRHYRPGEDDFSRIPHYPTVGSSLERFIDDPLLFEPGSDYAYSSYGYNLLSAAMEAATGEPFLDLIQSSLFDPLGLTGVTADHVYAILPHRTRFYARLAPGRLINAPVVDNSYKWAGGGFLASPRDIARFGGEILTPMLLQPETVHTLTTSLILPDGRETGYGLGFFDGLALFAEDQAEDAPGAPPAALVRAQASGRRIIEHRGGSVGGSAVLLISPDAEVVVAIAWNLTGAGDPLMLEALEIEARFADAGNPRDARP